MAPARRERGPGPEGQRLPRAARIRRGPEIRAVFAEGKRRKTKSLDVFILASPRARPRIGFVVPKLGHRIVDRNRLKRRLREIGRQRVLGRLWRAGLDADVLVRARRDAYRATYDQLEGELMGVVEAACSQG